MIAIIKKVHIYLHYLSLLILFVSSPISLNNNINIMSGKIGNITLSNKSIIIYNLHLNLFIILINSNIR